METKATSRCPTARLLAVAALPAMLLGATPVFGNSVSVSDLAANDGLPIVDRFPSAQGFTTGTKSAGYTLKSVTIKTRGGMGTITLRADAHGKPGDTLATLSTTGTSENQFLDLSYMYASGRGLAANTPYLRLG